MVSCVESKLTVPLPVNRTLPFLLYCVVDGLLPSGLSLLGVYLRVLEPTSMLLLSLDVIFSESNHPSFFVMFFLVVLSFFALFLVFFNLLWSCSLPLMLLFSFGATSSESNPLSFFVVLLMVFFLVVLAFLVLVLVFLNLY